MSSLPKVKAPVAKQHQGGGGNNNNQQGT